MLELMTMVSNLGQANLTARRYGKSPQGSQDWAADLVNLTIFVLPVVLGTSILAGIVYDLGASQLLFLFSNALMKVMLLSIAFMLGARGMYVWSAVLIRLPRGLLIIPAVLMLFQFAGATLELILRAQTALSALILFAALVVLKSQLARGPNHIGFRERLSAVVFLASSGTTLLMDRGLVVIAGAIVTAPQLAIYEAVSLIGRAFALLRGILYQVLMPELIKRAQPNIKRLVFGVWILAFGVASAMWIAGLPLLNSLFAGRYNAGQEIIPWFILAGFLLVGEVLPRSYIMGRSKAIFANRYVLLQISVIGIVTALGIPLIHRFNISGAVWTLAFAQLARIIISHSFWFKLWGIEKSKDIDV